MSKLNWDELFLGVMKFLCLDNRCWGIFIVILIVLIVVFVLALQTLTVPTLTFIPF